MIFSEDSEDPSIKRALQLARKRRTQEKELSETKKLDEQNRLRSAARSHKLARTAINSRGSDEDGSLSE